MTALGIALTVSMVVFIMSLLFGLRQAFAQTGDPCNVLALQKGATSEMTDTGIPLETVRLIKDLPGVAHNHQGEALVSGEDIPVISLSRRNGSGDVNVTVRFMAPIGIQLRPNARLVSGNWFGSGLRQVTVSRSLHERFLNTSIGDTIQIGTGAWTIVGIFDSGGTAHESEIWGDIRQIADDFNRRVFNSVLIRAETPQAAVALKRALSDDPRLKLSGMLEPDYYTMQSKSGNLIRFAGTIISLIMAIGSGFAGMNTMYAAVAHRSREIATLRIIGFSRISILTSFLVESVLLAILGAVIGIGVVVPLSGMTTATANAFTFSEAVFRLRLTPQVILSALLFAIIIGVLGGLAPAWRAARQNMASAVRD
jgi:putative ABC transport system permease protein